MRPCPLRAGIQNYQYNNHENLRDKYVNIDVSIPFSTWLSTGVSSQNGNMLANATLRKSLTTALLPRWEHRFRSRLNRIKMTIAAIVPTITPPMVTSAMTAKYNAGTVSVSRSSQHSSNYSLSSQGSPAWTEKMFMSAKALKPQAWWVNTNFSGKGG